MDAALLTTFQQAYQDLDLFPLVKPEEIEHFRVEYMPEVLVRLKQEVNASTKNGKFVFAETGADCAGMLHGVHGAVGDRTRSHRHQN
jgi:hypothetical protein